MLTQVCRPPRFTGVFMIPPMLHFAHANGLPSASYRKLLDRLAEHYQVQAIPMLGHHPSYPVNNNWELLTQQLIHHVENCARRPVIGVGHSLGGALTLKAAYLRPELFSQVILLDVPALTLTDSIFVLLCKQFRLIDQITPAKKSRSRRTHWPDKESALHYFKQRRLFANFDDDCLRDYVDAGLVDSAQGGVELAYQLAVELAVYRTLPHRPVYRARSLQVPVAVLVGEQSDTVRKYQYLRMKNRLNFVGKRVPGGHMFPLEHPLATADDIHQLSSALRRQA